MAQFGHFFVSGLLWIVIWLAVVAAGLWMSESRIGLVRVMAFLLRYGGALMAALSFWQLARVTRLQLKGIRMAREDPEGFARLAADFERANRADERPQAESQWAQSADTAYPEALPARITALGQIKSKVDELTGLDRTFAQRMLVAAAEIVEKFLTVPGFRLQASRLTSEAFLKAYKLALSQLTFTFFSPDPAARISTAALVTSLTDGNQVETSDLWVEFERCLDLKEASDDIRSLTAEITAQRILRLLGGREDALAVAILCFVGPSDAAFEDLRREFT